MQDPKSCVFSPLAALQKPKKHFFCPLQKKVAEKFVCSKNFPYLCPQIKNSKHMTSRILQLILGIVITVCSMPQGMAKDHTPQQPRVSFFTASAPDDEELQQATEQVSAGSDTLPQTFHETAFIDFGEAALAEGPGAETQGYEGKLKHHKRKHHRPAPVFGPAGDSDSFIIPRLSFHTQEKAYPRRPLTQDARQQRTATIRFAHLASAIC